MNMLELKMLIRALDREALRDMQFTAEETPLTPAETMIVGTVAKDGPISVGEIAKATGFVQSYVSSVLVRLEESGMLSSHRDPADRRRTVVSIHPRIRDQITESLVLEIRPTIERILGTDHAADAERVLDALDVLSQALAVGTTADLPAGIRSMTGQVSR